MRKVVSLVLWFLRLPFKKGEMGGRGQVAIFAALIFQVLFVFFAMVVNVGLLVHHKINLQNSVDLAAYYGAMKQAEALDAIAHVNYQIRQSWKLMVFRYRGLGMSGNEAKDSPFDPNKGILSVGANEDKAYSCPASFCNSYMAWDFMSVEAKENYCKDMCKGQRIRLPGQPFGSSLLGGLMMSRLPGIVSDIDKLSQLARNKVMESCEKASTLNWYALARFVFAFKNDVANRKKVLNRLANSISSKPDDLMDIDGQSVKAGALQTLFKNMTYQNQASLDPKTGASTGGTNGSFSFFNSLGAEGCAGTDGEEGVPPKWLSEIFVKPLYGYLDGQCEGEDDKVNFLIRILNAEGTDSLPKYRKGIDPSLIEFLRAYIQDPLTLNSTEARLWHTTTGYEKNPWCMAYVKVTASTTPKIPFSPFSPVKITATAYAKPFGGRVGPWFYKSWPASSDSSTGNSSTDQFDQTLPPRVRPGEQMPNISEDFYRIDHSRYVGDVVGVKSTMTMSRYAQAIFNKNGPKKNPRLNMDWWKNLLDESSDLSAVNNQGDILAWDAVRNQDPGIRTVEVGAVIPDQFDIANYSIEPNWWRTFAQRIQKRTDFGGLNVRGDLGFRRDAPAPWDTFTVKDQIALAIPDNTMDYDNALLYVAGRNAQDPKNAFAEVLTSWHNKVPGDYTLEPARFGKCLPGGVITGDPTEVEKGAPGDCMAGGRTGYSVKIVDEEAITGDQEIGGPGNTGKIKNLPTAK